MMSDNRLSDEDLLDVSDMHYDMSKWEQFSENTRDRHVQQSIAASLLVIARNSTSQDVAQEMGAYIYKPQDKPTVFHGMCEECGEPIMCGESYGITSAGLVHGDGCIEALKKNNHK